VTSRDHLVRVHPAPVSPAAQGGTAEVAEVAVLDEPVPPIPIIIIIIDIMSEELDDELLVFASASIDEFSSVIIVSNSLLVLEELVLEVLPPVTVVRSAVSSMGNSSWFDMVWSSVVVDCTWRPEHDACRPSAAPMLRGLGPGPRSRR
jgi:hypothetical protein